MVWNQVLPDPVIYDTGNKSRYFHVRQCTGWSLWVKLLTPEFQLPEMTDVTLFVLMIGHNTSLSSSWWDFDMAFYYLLFYQNLEHIVVEFSPFFSLSHTVWKILKMSHLKLWILAFSTNFCPIKTDLSGITVWPQALGFQKFDKMDYFLHFN